MNFFFFFFRVCLLTPPPLHSAYLFSHQPQRALRVRPAARLAEAERVQHLLQALVGVEQEADASVVRVADERDARPVEAHREAVDDATDEAQGDVVDDVDAAREVEHERDVHRPPTA